MAQAFPTSTFVGSDYDAGSIKTAQARAESAGVSDRVRFDAAPASGFTGKNYDLVTMFDCLHDMGDPVGAARHVREALAPDGTWMIVEPAAGDTLVENLNPVGRAYYLVLHLAVLPVLTLTRRRRRTRCPGGRGEDPRCRDQSRLQPIPQGDRDTVQHCVRSATLNGHSSSMSWSSRLGFGLFRDRRPDLYGVLETLDGTPAPS